MQSATNLSYNLDKGLRTISKTDHGSYLLHDPDLPFMAIGRKDDTVVSGSVSGRLAKSLGSFLVYRNEDIETVGEQICQITDAMQRRYKAFLVIEIEQSVSDEFKVELRHPQHGMEPVVKIFTDSFKQEVVEHGFNRLTFSTVQAEHVLSDQVQKLFSDSSHTHYTALRLSIPVSIKTGHPIRFRRFRERFSRLLRNAVYEFIRVQTTSTLPSYLALGRRSIRKEVFNIDAALTSIESQYEFLLQVAPTNISYIKEVFFSSGFEDIPEYEYRLLTLDPDILKRRLYDLTMEKIDDPALSFIFSEKRVELDRQLTMLRDRGNKRFYYGSLALHGEISDNLLKQARQILSNLSEAEADDQKKIDAKEFCAMARKEFDYYKEQDPEFRGKLHIRDDVNIIMVSKGELYLPQDYKMNESEAHALIQHELGTHALTYHNGAQQPLSQLRAGLADYDALQEGLAVFAEYLCGNLTADRLRILAGRVVAGQLLIDGADFKTMFTLLRSDYGFTADRAFDITSRMQQGGGFLKDIVYLRGMVQVIDYIKSDGELEPLLAGKFALKHLAVIRELTERNLLIPPKIKPRYLHTDTAINKINLIKEGLPLYKTALS